MKKLEKKKAEKAAKKAASGEEEVEPVPVSIKLSKVSTDG